MPLTFARSCARQLLKATLASFALVVPLSGVARPNAEGGQSVNKGFAFACVRAIAATTFRDRVSFLDMATRPAAITVRFLNVGRAQFH